MKFICYRKDLSEVLKTVIKAAAVKPMTPILSGIYIKAEGCQLELQANDYTVGIIARIPVKTEVAGEVVVSAKRLADFVAKFQGDMISADDSNGSLQIRSGNSNVELLTMDANDFPKVKSPDSVTNRIKMQESVLKDLLRKTTFAASVADDRPIFTGVMFDIKDDILSLVATNTHRISLAKTKVSIFDWTAPAVVPAKALNIVANTLNDDATPVEMKTDSRHAAFDFSNYTITVRLLEGGFPPFDKVLLKGSTTQAVLNAKDFKRALELVNVMAKEDQYNTVKLNIASGGINISSTSPDIGNAYSSVDAEITGDDLSIAFNAAYVSDFLKLTDGQINIRFNDRYSPAEFTAVDDDDFIYIVTPVRA